MENLLKKHFNFEIKAAKELIDKGLFLEAFNHLERAHILGQNRVMLHTIAHLYMLKVALLRKDAKEVFGQIIRIPLGILGSIVGVVPTGNTGGSNVSAFNKMEIPNDLKNLIDLE